MFVAEPYSIIFCKWEHTLYSFLLFYLSRAFQSNLLFLSNSFRKQTIYFKSHQTKIYIDYIVIQTSAKTV